MLGDLIETKVEKPTDFAKYAGFGELLRWFSVLLKRLFPMHVFK